ncbi:MAG: BatD family protein [Bacteroidetes bacterium]|nr:BatD family protein [Bacteroidota bacterium]
MKRIVYIAFLFLLLTNYLLAQKLTTSVSSNRVAVGEAFQIQFSLSGPGNNFKLPAMNDFEIYEGPYQSSSTSIVNGTVTQSSSLTYVIGAKKEGKFTIGAASVSSGGKVIQSNPVSIEVTKGAGNSGNSNNNSGNQNVTKPTSSDIGDNILQKQV